MGWTPGAELGLAEWSAVGRRFGEIGRCSQWWLGDWILYGNARFGERYSRAVKLTGYDAQSLMNMVHVTERRDGPLGHRRGRRERASVVVAFEASKRVLTALATPTPSWSSWSSSASLPSWGSR